MELDEHLDLYNFIMSVGAKKRVVTRLGNVQSDQRRADTDRKSDIENPLDVTWAAQNCRLGLESGVPVLPGSARRQLGPGGLLG